MMSEFTDHMIQQLFDEKVKTEKLRQQYLTEKISNLKASQTTTQKMLESFQTTMKLLNDSIKRNLN